MRVLGRWWLAGLLWLAAGLCHDLLADGAAPGAGPAIEITSSLARLDELDGSPSAGPVSLPRWRQAVFELRGGATRELGWPAARAVERAATAAVARNVIPLALVHAQFALTHDPDRRLTRELFAFSPLRRVNHFPLSTRFVFSRDAVLQSGVSDIVSIEFDAGDGAGPRRLDWDEPVDVVYTPGGRRELSLWVTLEDGSVRFSRALLDVIDGMDPPPPTATWAITATQDWEGEFASGQAYLYLAEGNTQLTNPVVVVEGFDIDNTIDWPVLYQLLNRENLLEDLRTQGFDTVVLDFSEAVEPIQRNAFVLTRLIELILAEIAPDQDMALIGASMGGLVSRYGLLWLEDQDVQHRVRNYISFDAPHNGANIPLGLQHWLAFFAGQSEDAEFFLSRLDSDASRQMLLYHHDSTSGVTAAADPLLGAFATDLAALGDWPQAPRLSTIINGSGNMSDQGFAAGDQIIEWIHRSFTVDIDGNVWSVPDGGSQVIFDGLIDIILLPAESETITISGTLPWDNAPGGYRETMAQLAEPEAPYGDIIALHPAHSFIPSVSALSLDSSDPFHDIAGDPNLAASIPFDAAYFPAANQEHIAITPENKAWFIDEINFGVIQDLILRLGFE